MDKDNRSRVEQLCSQIRASPTLPHLQNELDILLTGTKILRKKARYWLGNCYTCNTPLGAEREAVGQRCQDCAEKDCADVVARRKKNRERYLGISVEEPLLNSLTPASACFLKPEVLRVLLDKGKVFLDTEAGHKKHKWGFVYELAALRDSDYKEFYGHRVSESDGTWNIWIGTPDADGNPIFDPGFEKLLCSKAEFFDYLLEFVGKKDRFLKKGEYPVFYYGSANAIDENRLVDGLKSVGKAVPFKWVNVGFSMTFRLFGPHGPIKTPHLCQSSIYSWMFSAGGKTVVSPGTLTLKKGRKVFDDIYMLHDIVLALSSKLNQVVIEMDELEPDDFDVIDPVDEILFYDDAWEE